MRNSTSDSEFERLLKASSLGAPHVTKENAEIPQEVQEKLAAAAKKQTNRHNQ